VLALVAILEAGHPLAQSIGLRFQHRIQSLLNCPPHEPLQVLARTRFLLEPHGLVLSGRKELIQVKRQLLNRRPLLLLKRRKLLLQAH
jgi:hypothetical protein